jgi:CRISPR-associated protein Csx16
MTTYFISRHPGAIAWAQRQGVAVDTFVSHCDPTHIQRGDTVIGSLPLNLAAQVCARGAHYLHLSLELPETLRGQELTADAMEQLGARLEGFVIRRSPRLLEQCTADNPVLSPSLFDGIHGKDFFYPCAGDDIAPFLDAFGFVMDRFTFVDLNYQRSRMTPIVSRHWTRLPEHSRWDGPPTSRVQAAGHGENFREVEPGWLHEVYRHTAGDRCIQVRRRRGFGQYGLAEMADASLGVFCHRGDSSGEGGSNAWFYSNRNANHAPLGRLFDKVKTKLRLPALLVSDDRTAPLSRLANLQFSGADTDNNMPNVQGACVWEGLQCEAVAALRHGRRPAAVVWRVDKASSTTTT